MKKKTEDKVKETLKSLTGTIAGEVLWRAGGKKIFNSLADKALLLAIKTAEGLVDKSVKKKRVSQKLVKAAKKLNTQKNSLAAKKTNSKKTLKEIRDSAKESVNKYLKSKGKRIRIKASEKVIRKVSKKVINKKPLSEVKKSAKKAVNRYLQKKRAL